MNKKIPYKYNFVILVISGPSGAGKGTVIKQVLKVVKNFYYSVSVTSRKKRVGEVAGKHYHFISVELFKKKIKENDFLEWAKVHGNYYGTPREVLNYCKKNKKYLLLELDIQGSLSIKNIIPEAVLIFVMPSHFKELSKRLLNRNTEDKQQIQQRLQDAKEEIKFINEYDYLVINNNLKSAVKDVQAILHAENCKRKIYFVK